MARLCVAIVCGFAIFFSACATAPVVEPTLEESNAARRFKKTVAIIEVTDNGSPIKGITDSAFSKMENILAGHFNLVEREKILRVMQERNLSTSDAFERYNELGKLLGADYLFFGKAMAFFDKPGLEYGKRISDGKFYGSISTKYKANCELNFKIVSVINGVVEYSDKKNSQETASKDYRSFSDETAYEKELAVRMKTQQIIDIADNFGALKDDVSQTVVKAMDKAVVGFKNDLTAKFPITGEVMQVLSEKEVLVNLGSAYGIKVGDQLVVWEKMSEFRDPKTGLVTTPQRQKALLKVKKVTSGLSCVVEGSKKDVARISLGEQVST